jgi:hypothetical protein
MHVYGPPGIAHFIDVMLMVSDTFIGVPVIVYEFICGPVAAAEMEPVCLNTRSRVHRVCYHDC